MDIRVIFLLIDAFFIPAVILLSFPIRFPEGFHHTIFLSCYQSIPFIVAIWISSLAIMGVYRKRFISYWALFKKLSLGCIFAFLVSMSFVYTFRIKWGGFPVSVFLISFLLNLFLLFIIKCFLYKLFNRIYKKTVFVKEDDFNNLKNISEKLNDIDEIVLANELKDSKKMYLLFALADSLKIRFSILPELYDKIISRKINADYESFLFMPVYFRHSPDESLIRLLDLFLSASILFISLPVLILICILIKIDSAGPIIYKQIRIGKHGRQFTLYKFRTMVSDAEKHTGPILALLNDKRVTMLGKLLRRVRLDEMPQLLNVLKGEMSFVGPRPERHHFVKIHRALQGIRLSVKPGLTGLAQIQGYYHTVPRNKLRYDYLYIRKRSFLLNLNIIFKTMLVILFKPGS